MERRTVLIFSLLSFSLIASSSTGHHEGSISDLLYPAINAIIFFGGLIAILKKPLRHYFNNQVQKVSMSYDSSKDRYKEAELKLMSAQKKSEHVELDMDKIINKAKEDSKVFEQNSLKNCDDKIVKMKQDLESRLVHEKKTEEENICRQFVDEMILKTKEEISSEKNKISKVSESLIREIR